MKKTISFLLALAMVLPLMACGGTGAEPTEETTLATTEAVAQNEYVAYELTDYRTYDEAVRAMGYVEVYPGVQGTELDVTHGLTDGYCIPTSLEVCGDGFRMELDCTERVTGSKTLKQTTGWTLYGTKADRIGRFVELDPKRFDRYRESTYNRESEDQAYAEEYGLYAYEYAQYMYHRRNEDGKVDGIAYLIAVYFPETGNLYNLFGQFNDREDGMHSAPWVFHTNYWSPAPQEDRVETLQWNDISFELHEFAIQCGVDRYVYQYRPGMTLSAWACSELNTDGWIPWYADYILSPDRKYVCGSSYRDIQQFMIDGTINTLNTNVITAKIYKNNLNHYSYSGLVVHDAEGNLLADSPEAYQAYMESQGMSLEADVVENNGNIDMFVAHMVNARTPLCTPGFRIVGKEGGYAAYHSVANNSWYLLNDILDIYMNGVADELIPYIKLYAFPESQEFMATLEGHTILNVHPTPLEQGDSMLTIPEDAVCLTFQRVRDGQEAPNSPNPRNPGHQNLNKDAVYARYVTKDDPNFSEDVNLVFAITFDDELVYWIHMGSNFQEKLEIEWTTWAMPY